MQPGGLGHGGSGTARKRYSAEQIANKLREAEVHLARILSVEQMCRRIGVTDQAKRFEELKREKARLMKLVAELSLDNPIPQDIASGND